MVTDVLRVLQPPALSLRHRHADAGHGALWPSRAASCHAPTHAAIVWHSVGKQIIGSGASKFF